MAENGTFTAVLGVGSDTKCSWQLNSVVRKTIVRWLQCHSGVDGRSVVVLVYRCLYSSEVLSPTHSSWGAVKYSTQYRGTVLDSTAVLYLTAPQLLYVGDSTALLYVGDSTRTTAAP